MDGLTVAEADLEACFHPSKSNNFSCAILRQLSSLIFTYDEIFDGVILAYEVNIPSKRAKIISGFIPHIGVKKGKVVRPGRESIHIVVLGFSSVDITFEDIREDFKYKIKHGDGVFVSSSHVHRVIKTGSVIRFQVKSVNEEILHVSGSSLPSDTGCIRWLSKHGTEHGSQVDSLKTKSNNEREMLGEDKINSIEGEKSPNTMHGRKTIGHDFGILLPKQIQWQRMCFQRYQD